MTWLDDSPPPAPRLSALGGAAAVRVGIMPAPGEAAFLWVVQWRAAGAWRSEILPASVREWTSDSATAQPDAIWVSAVDRSGNRSAPVRVR
jgi:hypothetical protein